MGWCCLWMFPKWLHKNKLATKVWLDICKFIRPRLHSNSKFIHPVNWKERCLLRCFLCHEKMSLLINLCHFTFQAVHKKVQNRRSKEGSGGNFGRSVSPISNRGRQIMPSTLLLVSPPGFSDLKYSPVSDLLLQPKNDQYRYFCYLKEFLLLFDWNPTIVQGQASEAPPWIVWEIYFSIIV